MNVVAEKFVAGVTLTMPVGCGRRFKDKKIRGNWT